LRSKLAVELLDRVVQLLQLALQLLAQLARLVADLANHERRLFGGPTHVLRWIIDARMQSKGRRQNPFNWFKPKEPEAPTKEEATAKEAATPKQETPTKESAAPKKMTADELRSRLRPVFVKFDADGGSLCPLTVRARAIIRIAPIA
jgi:hypothetical protein